MTKQSVAQSLRLLGITSERIAATVADRVGDASVRSIVGKAVVDELSWLERLIAEAEAPPTLTDAERSVLRGLRDDYAFRRKEHCQRVASVLDGLLARLGGGA